MARSQIEVHTSREGFEHEDEAYERFLSDVWTELCDRYPEHEVKVDECNGETRVWSDDEAVLPEDVRAIVQDVFDQGSFWEGGGRR